MMIEYVMCDKHSCKARKSCSRYLARSQTFPRVGDVVLHGHPVENKYGSCEHFQANDVKTNFALPELMKSEYVDQDGIMHVELWSVM